MPRGLTLSRRLSTALRWPVGLGLTSWHYMWRTTPISRTETPADLGDCRLPALPDEVERDEILFVEDGAGPMFHRLYRTRIAASKYTSEELIQRIAADPNRVTPSEFARFFKVKGRPDELQVGDEFTVRMPGPWDGPVRVVAAGPRSFRLATLEGHLEAGQIEFRAYEDDGVSFEIESWARSGDRLSGFLFDRLRFAKEVQLHMWLSVLERVTKFAGGKRIGLNSIETERIEFDA